MLARYEQWLQHAFQNQLFLCAYLHGKRVMTLACERVITCRVRAFTLFSERPCLVQCDVALYLLELYTRVCINFGLAISAKNL